MTEDTFTSNAGGDGWTIFDDWDVNILSWYGKHCSNGELVYDSTTTMGAASQWEWLYGSVWYLFIGRAFIPFDTSSLPTDITISAATIKVRVTGKTGTGDTGLVQTTQDDPEDLVIADHQRCGTCPHIPAEGAPRMSNPTVNTYHTFSLNATGKGWIVHDGSSFSKFGLRDEYDIDELSGGTAHSYQFNQIATANHATSAYRPLLTVTYTIPTTAGKSQAHIF